MFISSNVLSLLFLDIPISEYTLIKLDIKKMAIQFCGWIKNLEGKITLI